MWLLENLKLCVWLAFYFYWLALEYPTVEKIKSKLFTWHTNFFMVQSNFLLFYSRAYYSTYSRVHTIHKITWIIPHSLSHPPPLHVIIPVILIYSAWCLPTHSSRLINSTLPPPRIFYSFLQAAQRFLLHPFPVSCYNYSYIPVSFLFSCLHECYLRPARAEKVVFSSPPFTVAQCLPCGKCLINAC